MKNSDFAEVNKVLYKKLKKDRYLHTMGVANTAAYLAILHGEDPKKAYLAGLLHDYAKSFKSDKYVMLCQKHEIDISDTELKNPSLLHAKLGEYYAKNKFNISDSDILNSIRWHTTGHPDMSLLEKIVYIADYIEPLRTKQKRLSEIRKVAAIDINRCMFMILEDTVNYLSTRENAIDKNTQLTYEFYKNIIGE